MADIGIQALYGPPDNYNEKEPLPYDPQEPESIPDGKGKGGGKGNGIGDLFECCGCVTS